MARTIYKYHVCNTYKLPAGAKPLLVGMQHGEICMWAEVETDKPLVPVEFHIQGTGEVLPDNPGFYQGTVFNGSFVWHIYLKGI